MQNTKKESLFNVRVLATDLDGTLIPLPDRPENKADLKTLSALLAERGRELIFCTGRHYESVVEALDVFDLPLPKWMICGVGSAIYENVNGGFRRYGPYNAHLNGVAAPFELQPLRELMTAVEGVTLQIEAHQDRFKLSYDCEGAELEAVSGRVNELLADQKLPFHCMASLDPFHGVGFLDIMPAGVTKAYALAWLSTHGDFDPEEVVYAGDSGNDLAALTHGFRAIVVGNATDALAEQVRAVLTEKGMADRAYRAEGFASSGVLEGCRHFGLV
jgi:HAD superfamily hydrolase (TIGR01484 family)